MADETPDTAAVRRRMRADIEDAKRALWRAQAHYDKTVKVLADFEREQRRESHA